MASTTSDFVSATAVMRPGSTYTAGAGTSFYWNNVANALTSDNTYSSCTTTSSPITNWNGYTNYLTTNDLNTFIPTSSTINGITVSIERKNTLTGQADTLDVSTDALFLMYDSGGIATTIGQKKSSATLWTSSDSTENFGNSTDTWGRSWTASEINNANFGVALSAYLNYTYAVEGSGPAGAAQVDAISVTIDYTDSSNTRRRAVFVSKFS